MTASRRSHPGTSDATDAPRPRRALPESCEMEDAPQRPVLDTIDPDSLWDQDAAVGEPEPVDGRKHRRGEARRARQLSPGRRIFEAAREFVIVVVVALLVATWSKTFLGPLFGIPTQPMGTTVPRTHRGLVGKVGHYQRGDIIVFEDNLGWLPAENPPSTPRRVLEFVGVMPVSGNQYLIKRLVGLPGDHVVCCSTNGRISVNGVEIEEDSYLYRGVDGKPIKPSEIAFDVIVPENRVFVLGDHRDASADSRYHLCDVTASGKGANAFPALDSIQGPARLNVFPFSRFTTFSAPATYSKVPAAQQTPPSTAVVSGGGC